ncbi:MAG: DUF302 domain-containing protein [Bacteroidota bacterium]
MKKAGLLLTGFAAGIMFVVLTGAAIMSEKIFVVDESKYEFIETIDRIEALAKESGWNISHMYNLQATMAKHNLEVEPVVVMSLCKPQIAYNILGADSERPASVMMPCRVSVYQTKDGKVQISRMNTGLMSGMLAGITRSSMDQAGNEIETLLNQVIKK